MTTHDIHDIHDTHAADIAIADTDDIASTDAIDNTDTAETSRAAATIHDTAPGDIPFGDIPSSAGLTGDGPTAASSLDDGRTPSDRAARDARTDAFEAARLIAFGLRPRLVPARDATYAELIRRYLRDPAFADLTGAVAAGLGLVILDVSERAGMVPAGGEDSAFTVRITDYARRAGGEHRAADRLLHALAHLAIAALAFPRPADLTDDSYVGRVSVDGVDAFVREACRLLEERTAGGDPAADPPADLPALEAAWRLYARRPSTGATRDSRRLAGSTTGIIARAMAFLVESGCLVQVGDQAGGTYRTTPRYQVQVRELAADSAMEELLNLGVVTVADGSGGIRVLSPEPALPGTDGGRMTGADSADLADPVDSADSPGSADSDGSDGTDRAGGTTAPETSTGVRPERGEPGHRGRPGQGEPGRAEPDQGRPDRPGPGADPGGRDAPETDRPAPVRPAAESAGADQSRMDDEAGMNGPGDGRGGRHV